MKVEIETKIVTIKVVRQIWFWTISTYGAIAGMW
jgi:hypothetical protein